MSTTLKKHLSEWYNPARRALPWKKSKSPYQIWLSEIILQQTRVEQGTPYYLAFTHRFPSIVDLAKAPLDDILKTWEGLGYYSRARNLHEAARQVVSDFGGHFPADYHELLQLKGVGTYTAAAIASFAFDLPYAVLDGNVFRVLSRYFGIDAPIDSTEGKKLFSKLAQECLDTDNPSRHNQAIMDFGALVCTPQNPSCYDCPLSGDCIAYREKKVTQLPVKSKKIIKQHRHFNFLVISDGNNTVVQQRGDRDIWKGLHQFPLLETELLQSHLTPADFGIAHSDISSFRLSDTYKQTLTHRFIVAHFLELKVSGILSIPEDCQLVSLSDIKQLAFPRIIRHYLQDSLLLNENDREADMQI
jgi:A/G-specific adenine glycosylase